MVGVGSGALPWRRAHGRGQEHAVDSSGLVWSLPVGAEGREGRVGRGNGLGGRLRGLLHSGEHHGMATGAVLPGMVKNGDQIRQIGLLPGGSGT